MTGMHGKQFYNITINVLGSEENGNCFTEDIFNCILPEKNVYIKASMTLISKGRM